MLEALSAIVTLGLAPLALRPSPEHEDLREVSGPSLTPGDTHTLQLEHAELPSDPAFRLSHELNTDSAPEAATTEVEALHRAKSPAHSAGPVAGDLKDAIERAAFEHGLPVLSEVEMTALAGNLFFGRSVVLSESDFSAQQLRDQLLQVVQQNHYHRLLALNAAA